MVLLGDVNTVFKPGELVAVVGTPGAGKSTLLKLVAGIRRPTFGTMTWTVHGEPIPLHPPVGYLPQSFRSDSCERSLLTVAEEVAMALRLRVVGMDAKSSREQALALLEKMGLGALADRRPETLNLAQQRLLELTIELTGSPALLLCDESPGTYDPKTESEFTELLRSLAVEDSLAAVRVTHALGNLENYDSVIVLHGGQLAYDGPPEFLTHYFELGSPVELYSRLATRRPEEWHRSWIKHGAAYQTLEGRKSLAKELSGENQRQFLEKHPPATDCEAKTVAPFNLPGAFSQCLTLLKRRWLLAWRNTPWLAMQLALLFGFPCAVAFFATGDLPRLQELSEQLKGNVVEQLKENAVFAVNASHGVGLVAGLAMAQALLLAFMAVQNASREIAGGRLAFEREKFHGLRPGA